MSKGAALEVIVESCTGYSGTRTRAEARGDERTERESNLSDSPDALMMAKEAGGATSADDVRPSPARADEARLSEVAGRAESTHPDATAALDFILSIGNLTMRDEDLFANLHSRDVDDVPYAEYLPDAEHVWTCRVGKQPSQARRCCCGCCCCGGSGGKQPSRARAIHLGD